jgi:hypothetical protein
LDPEPTASEDCSQNWQSGVPATTAFHDVTYRLLKHQPLQLFIISIISLYYSSIRQKEKKKHLRHSRHAVHGSSAHQSVPSKPRGSLAASSNFFVSNLKVNLLENISHNLLRDHPPFFFLSSKKKNTIKAEHSGDRIKLRREPIQSEKKKATKNYQIKRHNFSSRQKKHELSDSSTRKAAKNAF